MAGFVRRPRCGLSARRAWLAALLVLAPASQQGLAAPAAGANAGAQAAQAPWWRTFASPALDAYMVRIERDNTTLAAAAARLAEARALARLGRAAALPQVGLAASANYAGGPLINAAGGSGALFTGSFGAAWEPDLLGRLAPSRRAGKAEVRAAEADLAGARLLVEAHAVRAWFTAVALAGARREAEAKLALAREGEDIARASLARGRSSQADVDERMRRTAAAQSRLADLTARLSQARNALGYLAGEKEPVTPADDSLPAVPPVPANLQSDLIERRPDVAAAMARVDAAVARHIATRRDWLPRFGLTATGGTASSTLAGLLSAGAGSFGLGLLAAFPLVDGGAHKARVAGAEAAKALAEAQLRDALLASWRDTGDALAASEQARAAFETEVLRSQLAETDETRARRAAERGSIGRAALIEKSEAALQARGDRALRELGTIEARIALIVALGGGWSGDPSFTLGLLEAR